MERLRYLADFCTQAFGAYTPQIILIVVLAFVSSIAEGLGISAIIPIFSFVVGGSASSASDTISRIIAGFFSLIHLPYSFRMLLVFIAVLFVVRVLVVFSIQYVTARFIFNYERDLRRRLFSETLSARWPYLSTQRVGNLEQLLTMNASNAAQLFGNIATSALVATKVLIYIAIAVNISWWIAALSLGSGVAMFFILRPWFYRNRAVATDAEKTNRAIAHFVGEHAIGMKAIKAMALEAPVMARGREYFETMRSLNIRSVLLRGQVQALVQLAAVGFVGIVFALMYRSPNFSIAAFLVIVYAIQQIFAQIQAGQAQLHGFTSLLPYTAEALRYSRQTSTNKEPQGGGGGFALSREIEFRNVSFSYPEREAVLRHANFVIRKGELLGIVGPSGAGKTTIADLLLRLIEPSEGSLAIDGRDIHETSAAAWRTHVGYVAQDAVLLNDTIEENIRFYNAKLSKADIVNAAKLANIHGFIETLSQGYGTVIGDRGVLLSGGQRQRVALARVLARKPALLVLDEATSSLDSESERAIQTAVEGLRGGITVVVIAHRLSTIKLADRFLGVDAGIVKELTRESVFNDAV